MTKKELIISQVNKLAKKNATGTIKMWYGDELIGSYQLPDEGTLDSLRPDDWIKENLDFEIDFKDRKISNVRITFEK